MPKNENWFLMYWDMAAALDGFACAAHSVLNSCANCIASLSTPLTRLEGESIAEEEAGVSRSLSPVKQHCPELEASSAVSEASTLCCTAAAFLLLPANLHRLVFGIPSLAEIEKQTRQGMLWVGAI